MEWWGGSGWLVNGMQGVRGSSPLSSTTKPQVRRYDTGPRTSRVAACCQQGTPRQLPNRASDCAGHTWS